MTKEEIYDTQISPLMKEVIRICKEADIPLVADFQLDNDRTAIGDARRGLHRRRVATNDGPDGVIEESSS